MKCREDPTSQSSLHLDFSFHESHTVFVRSVTLFPCGAGAMLQEAVRPGPWEWERQAGVKTDDGLGVKDVGRKQGLDGSSC